MNRFAAMSSRRSELVVECDRTRQLWLQDFAALRTGATLALLGWSASRLLVRKPWWRALALGGLAMIAARFQRGEHD